MENQMFSTAKLKEPDGTRMEMRAGVQASRICRMHGQFGFHSECHRQDQNSCVKGFELCGVRISYAM